MHSESNSDTKNNVDAKKSSFQDTKNFFENRCKNEKRPLAMLARKGAQAPFDKPPQYTDVMSADKSVSKVKYLKSKLEKISMDFDQMHIKKKFKKSQENFSQSSFNQESISLPTKEPTRSTPPLNTQMIESTSILKSLLRSEPNLMQQFHEHYQSNSHEEAPMIAADSNKTDSEESNLSVIINSDTEEDKENNDTDKSCISFSSLKSEQNETFYVNSDSEEEALPKGWSVSWASNGRKYYIGIYFCFS